MQTQVAEIDRHIIKVPILYILSDIADEAVNYSLIALMQLLIKSFLLRFYVGFFKSKNNVYQQNAQ